MSRKSSLDLHFDISVDTLVSVGAGHFRARLIYKRKDCSARKFVKVNRDSPRRECLGENSTRGDPLCPGCIVERTTSSLGERAALLALYDPPVSWELISKRRRRRATCSNSDVTVLNASLLSFSPNVDETNERNRHISASSLFFFFFFFLSPRPTVPSTCFINECKRVRRNRAREFLIALTELKQRSFKQWLFFKFIFNSD